MPVDLRGGDILVNSLFSTSSKNMKKPKESILYTTIYYWIELALAEKSELNPTSFKSLFENMKSILMSVWQGVSVYGGGCSFCCSFVSISVSIFSFFQKIILSKLGIDFVNL